MKSTLLLLSALAAGTVSAQDDKQAIAQWQSLHPTTLLISADRYNSLTDAEQLRLGKDVIIFQETITLEQLQAYDSEKTSVSTAQPAAKEEDLQIIKDWLGNHQDVRIVKRSAYLAATAEQLEAWSASKILVLIGETLTVADILNYH